MGRPLTARIRQSTVSVASISTAGSPFPDLGKVVHFNWCNDFAAARNAGLSLAKGEWFMYLDDDEWFEDIEPLVWFFESGDYKTVACANYIQRNYHEKELIHYSDFWVSRMIRLEEDTHFESKIHEYLYPVTGACRNLNLIAGHTGYIYEKEEDKWKHFKRNAELLQDMIEKEPRVMRWRVQMIQEYRSMHLNKQLIDTCIEYLDEFRDVTSANDLRDLCTMYLGLVEGYRDTKQYEKALEAIQMTFDDKRMMELCQACMYLEKGTVLYRMGRYEEAERAIQNYLIIKDFMTAPERINMLNLQKGVLLVGDAFNDLVYKRACSVLCASALRRDDSSELMRFLKELEWTQEVAYVFDDMFETITAAMYRKPKNPDFEIIVRTIWSGPVSQKKFLAAIESWRKKDKDLYFFLLAWLARLDSEDWYALYAKILTARRDKDVDYDSSWYAKLLATGNNVFMYPEEIYSCEERERADAEAAFAAVSYDTWTANWKEYLKLAPQEARKVRVEQMKNICQKEDIRFSYLWTRAAEKNLLQEEKNWNKEELQGVLKEFADWGERLARHCYLPTILDEHPDILPQYMESALYLHRGFAVEASDEAEAFMWYQRAMKAYPQMEGTIRWYMVEVRREDKRKQEQAKKELRQLQRKCKEKIDTLLEQGQYVAALEAAQGLKQMLPKDVDVIRASLQARMGILEARIEE